MGSNWSQLQSTALFDLSRTSSNFITQLLNQERIITRSYDLTLTGSKYSIYGDLRYQYSPLLFVDFGIRYDHQSWIEKQQLSPRVNISYFYNPTTTIRFGYGRHQQTQNLDSFLFEDNELSYFDPEIADIFVLETTKKFENNLSIRAEAYYKDYQYVQPYYENLFVGLQLNPELFADRIRVSPNTARAKGIDITVAKEFQNISVSIAYSYASIVDIFDESIQNRSWDQRNSLKLNTNWKYKKWGINSILTYRNGWPRTNIINSDELFIQERNIDKFSDFINLDFRIDRQLQFKATDSTIWFQLTNAFNQRNQCCTEYSYLPDENNQLLLTAKPRRWLPLIPSVGINFYFD